ncbi:MAG: penicillin-binding protein 1A [Gammaproteobacteria bacterium]
MWSITRVFFSIALVAGIAALFLVVYLQQQLPDVNTLKDVRMQVPLRVYSADKQLIAEYGEQRRIPIKLADVPPQLINAVLATEDRRFYQHPGVDIRGLLRASLALLTSGGDRAQGGSTITMQVARNFFLTREKSFIRKINEILLSFKIERELTKDEILELYLNKVFFGKRAYGVAAAAEVYYGKKLNQLTLQEMAMIAGLPQAPSAINPISNPKAAFARRKHVLESMYEYGFITEAEFKKAVDSPIAARYHGANIAVPAPYVGDMVLQELLSYLGEDVYNVGYKVYTTVDSRLQQAANNALQNGLQGYSERHGYHGPEQQWKAINLQDKVSLARWQQSLQAIPTVNSLLPAAILNVKDDSAVALLANGKTITLSWDNLKWAKAYDQNKARDFLLPGAVVRVRLVKNQDVESWRLAQVPKIQGALVALNPQDGSLLALTGGYNYQLSKFNRATQAERQPGSAFKPFIYSAALNKGYSAATIINDAPIVVHDYSVGWWRPQNNTRQFYGPTRIRVGLAKSLNLVSIRLLQLIGVSYAVDFITKFGFTKDQLPHGLSLALGTLVTTPLQMTNAFGIFANGGYAVTPHYVRSIVDVNGQEIFTANPTHACMGCETGEVSTYGENQAPQVISSDNAYIMTSMMQDVINKGTAIRAQSLGRKDLAGKTGTSNDQRDTWFVGYNANIVATVWSGFDEDSASTGEYGSNLALPIWIDFMQVALEGQPENTLPQPSDIITKRIDSRTGQVTSGPGIVEFFAPGTVPSRAAPAAANPYVEGESLF